MASVEAVTVLRDERIDVPDIETLYTTHAESVARWAARLGGPGIDAEDVVQDVFVVAQRRLHEFRGDGSPRTWLYHITERLVWNRRRRERIRSWWRRTRQQDEAEIESRTPLEQLQSKQATALFYRALDGIGERYRSVIVLYELEGMSGQEIAELKGVPVGTVWVWLHRARAKLLAAFAKLAPADFDDGRETP